MDSYYLPIFRHSSQVNLLWLSTHNDISPQPLMPSSHNVIFNSACQRLGKLVLIWILWEMQCLLLAFQSTQNTDTYDHSWVHEEFDWRLIDYNYTSTCCVCLLQYYTHLYGDRKARPDPSVQWVVNSYSVDCYQSVIASIVVTRVLKITIGVLLSVHMQTFWSCLQQFLVVNIFLVQNSSGEQNDSFDWLLAIL